MLVQGLLPLLALARTAFSQLVVDEFKSSATNSLGSYHGCDGAMSCVWDPNGGLTITASDTDYSFYSQLENGGCQDISKYDDQYLHIKFSGSSAFTVALQQHNSDCNKDVAPYPETWDVVNAADYSKGEDIYIPMKHFNIIKSRATGIAFKAFREPSSSTKFTKIEIVQSILGGLTAPEKKPTGPLVFACTRPNSIAFGIDDGAPALEQEMMDIIKKAGIKVTFFTVGNSLDDPSQNFTSLYKEAAANGHQIAFHSYTHPKIEGLNNIDAIDGELKKSHEATLKNIGVDSKYFRAPYGTDGALTRQRLQATVPGAKVIAWSVDIKDWVYGAGDDAGDAQTAAAKSDLARGGNLFVAHYLYPSTVRQFAAFIDAAKATGKQIMRIDQCLEDPNAPPL